MHKERTFFFEYFDFFFLSNFGGERSAWHQTVFEEVLEYFESTDLWRICLNTNYNESLAFLGEPLGSIELKLLDYMSYDRLMKAVRKKNRKKYFVERASGYKHVYYNNC